MHRQSLALALALNSIASIAFASVLPDTTRLAPTAGKSRPEDRARPLLNVQAKFLKALNCGQRWSGSGTANADTQVWPCGVFRDGKPASGASNASFDSRDAMKPEPGAPRCGLTVWAPAMGFTLPAPLRVTDAEIEGETLLLTLEDGKNKVEVGCSAKDKKRWTYGDIRKALGTGLIDLDRVLPTDAGGEPPPQAPKVD